MRNLEDIESDLAAAREALSKVEGTPAEVYSRIVGYYRSVRNWNKGKREEYGERRLYLIKADEIGSDEAGRNELSAAAPSPSFKAGNTREFTLPGEERLLLFVRASCPGCGPAKAAAGRLGIPVVLVNTDTPEGMAEAVRRNVLSTPTAILLSPAGEEIARARDAGTISSLVRIAEPIAV